MTHADTGLMFYGKDRTDLIKFDAIEMIEVAVSDKRIEKPDVSYQSPAMRSAKVKQNKNKKFS